MDDGTSVDRRRPALNERLFQIQTVWSDAAAVFLQPSLINAAQSRVFVGTPVSWSLLVITDHVTDASPVASHRLCVLEGSAFFLTRRCPDKEANTRFMKQHQVADTWSARTDQGDKHVITLLCSCISPSSFFSFLFLDFQTENRCRRQMQGEESSALDK